MRTSPLFVIAALCAGACSSTVPDDGGDYTPTAPKKAYDRWIAAKEPGAAAVSDANSPSRVLGYVEGEVVTYREVLQMVGPQLAQAETPAEKSEIEDRALIDIVRERMMYRTALDAQVGALREEIEERRALAVKDLAKNGGTLEAFLHDYDMTRREFDDVLKRQIILEKYRNAAIGRSGDPSVHVRPVTDTFVPPEEVRKYYDRHPEKFQQPASARCRMLTFKTDLEASDRQKAFADTQRRAAFAMSRLRAGEDWVPVFRAASEKTAEQDPLDGLMEIRKGDNHWADWIQDFAYNSTRGTLSEVIEKGTTCYVLRAEGAHEERTVPFEEVEASVRRDLTAVRSQLAWYEVQLSVLDESSIQPDTLRSRLRETLRRARQTLITSAGL